MLILHPFPRLSRVMLLRLSGLLVCSLFGLAGALRATDSPSLPAGRYVLDRASLSAFEQALAETAKQFPAIQRQTALNRLRERLNPPAEIEIGSSDAGLAVRLGENQFPHLQPGGAAVPWTGKDGQRARVSLRWRGEALEQSVASGDRTRLNAFSFDLAEKILLLEIQLHGSQLRRPVSFAVRYLPAS